MIGVALNAGMYLGFETLADIYKFSGWELTVRQFGFNEHYTSVSRGVLDVRLRLLYRRCITVLEFDFNLS